MSQETIIPTFNKDPPITMEEALLLVQGDPDKYSIRSLYVIANLLSMTGFMVYLSAIFLFQEPKNQLLQLVTQQVIPLLCGHCMHTLP